MNFPEGGEAEISDFEVHVVVDEDVFKFQVSVNDTLAVHVLEHIAHLREEETAAVFAHASKSLAQVEKETTGNELEKNVNEVADFSARWFHNFAV